MDEDRLRRLRACHMLTGFFEAEEARASSLEDNHFRVSVVAGQLYLVSWDVSLRRKKS